ncbi:dihydrodipicolinate synthase family protein, partial [Enterococcus faecalis]|uniref:dihydrodipicolinate synthase family protein n=1 Tax=Enterococcus faecalis TaxID=1351 RepID=UPI003CC672E8
MKDLTKYYGVIPAFYASYDENGEISPERVQALTKYFVEKKVKGVYVNGSSGQFIYKSVQVRQVLLE